MAKKALIVWGGWEGHEPKEVSEIFRKTLEEEGFEVEVSDTLDAFLDEDKLKSLNLIVPYGPWVRLPRNSCSRYWRGESGVGLAGCHGECVTPSGKALTGSL